MVNDASSLARDLMTPFHNQTATVLNNLSLVSWGRLFQMWGPKYEKVLEMSTVPDVISLISLVVSVDAKHHVYLLCNKSSTRLIPQCD